THTHKDRPNFHPLVITCNYRSNKSLFLSLSLSLSLSFSLSHTHTHTHTPAQIARLIQNMKMPTVTVIFQSWVLKTDSWNSGYHLNIIFLVQISNQYKDQTASL